MILTDGQVIGVKGAVAAFSSPSISLWPYKFVTGLLEKVLEMGAVLYTNTPVSSVQASSGGTTLSTSKGDMHASKVVYASNAYVGGLLPQYRRVILPVVGQNSHIMPNEATLRRVPTPASTYNFHYSASWVDYLNPRPGGGIIHGGGGRSFRKDRNDRSRKWFDCVDDSVLIGENVAEDFRKFDEEHFYGWEGSEAKVDSTWTGGKSFFLQGCL